MEKRKYYAILIGACVISAVLGISIGYFVIGPVGVSARGESARANAAASGNLPTYGTLFDGFYALNENNENSENNENYLSAYANHDIYTRQNENEHMHGFIVTSHDGFIVVYYAGGKSEGLLRETTSTPVNALPPEDRERLAQGIRVYTEEALVRLLEDYGS